MMTDEERLNAICRKHFDFLLEHGFSAEPIESRKHGMWLIKRYSIPEFVLSVSYEWEGFVGLVFDLSDQSTTDIGRFFECIGFKPEPFEWPIFPKKKRKLGRSPEEVAAIMEQQLRIQLLPALRHLGYKV